METQARKLQELVIEFLGLTGRVLPDDVRQRLTELRAEEESPLALAVYDSMFKNLQRAEALNRPCCQDTGLIQFFVQAGTGFPLINELEGILVSAVREATDRVPLRHNAVEIFAEVNTACNAGERAPWIEWEIVPDSSELVLYSYMAGGGCSLPGHAKVLMPSAGYEAVVEFVFDTIVNMGINACPPLLVGVGIGTCVSSAAKLSKKALLRPVGSHHPHPRGAMMEAELKDGLNAVGLGPQGLGGAASVMGVNIETAARHPSSMGVGVSVGCWAHRRGCIRIREDLSYELISHRGQESRLSDGDDAKRRTGSARGTEEPSWKRS
ncbi:MAG: L(+)-tartrate dehydratase subunit alpha [Syntrophomonadaceae bacterium]|nr:L(+)-tartrate dehydratase subunit alpha [Syntrophomonadaceae bacterium]